MSHAGQESEMLMGGPNQELKKAGSSWIIARCFHAQDDLCAAFNTGDGPDPTMYRE